MTEDEEAKWLSEQCAAYNWLAKQPMTTLKRKAETYDELLEALKATTASLAAAISLLERAGKTAKKAAPSDTMFDMMISDYRKALDEARAAIAKAEGRT